jgi:hypothetical protein
MKLADLVNVVNPYTLVRIKKAGDYRCRFFGQWEELEEEKPEYLEEEVFDISTDIDDNYCDDALLDIYVK